MFRATHIGGPLDGPGNDVNLAAPRVPTVLRYAPGPPNVGKITAVGYIVVGVDEEPQPPWPDQVTYALARERSSLEPHPTYPDEMEVGTAVYIYQED